MQARITDFLDLLDRLGELKREGNIVDFRLDPDDPFTVYVTPKVAVPFVHLELKV